MVGIRQLPVASLPPCRLMLHRQAWGQTCHCRFHRSPLPIEAAPSKPTSGASSSPLASRPCPRSRRRSCARSSSSLGERLPPQIRWGPPSAPCSGVPVWLAACHRRIAAITRSIVITITADKCRTAITVIAAHASSIMDWHCHYAARSFITALAIGTATGLPHDCRPHFEPR
jgi:hypothetical protein